MRAVRSVLILVTAVVLVCCPASAKDDYPLHGLDRPASRIDEFVGKCGENPTPELLTTTGWLLHVYRNDNEKARELFKNALEAEPESAWARYGLCVIDEIKGDFSSVLSNSLAICGSSPSHPVALLALLSVRSLFGKMSRYNEQVEPVLRHLFQEDDSLPIQFREICREILSAISWLRGDEEEWRRLLRAGDFLTEWRIVGPFGEFPNLSFLSKWQPESDRSLKSHYKVGECVREAKQYFSEDGLLHPHWLQRGVYYAETFLRSPSTEEVILRVSSYSACELFLNNHRIYQKDAVRNHCPITEYIRLDLSRGYNRLLLKFLNGGQAQYSRDAPYNSLQGGCVVRRRFTGTPSVQVFRCPYGPASVRCTASPRRWRRVRQVEVSPHTPSALSYVSDLLTENPDDPVALGLCGVLHSVQGDVQLAKRSLRTAVKHTSSYPYFNCILGMILRNDPSLPMQTRWSEAKTLFDSAIEAAGVFPRALYQTAVLDAEEDRDLEAIEKLIQCIAQSPGYLPWHDELYGLYEEKEWRDEQRRQLETIVSLNFDSCRPYHLAEEYYRSTKQCRRLTDAVERLQATHIHSDSLARYYRRIGRDAEAIAHYSRLQAAQPYSEQTRRSLVELYQRNERWVEAERELRAALKLFPKRGWFWKELAALQGRTGRRGAERRTWRRVLREHPVDRDARKALRAHGYKDMLDEFDISPWPYVRDQSIREKYTGVSSAMIIDQVVEEIYPDCSSRQKTHQLILLNDKDAIDEWGELDIPEEEVLELRTIKKDGTVVEPERPEGSKWATSMGGLQEGDFIELKYIVSTSGAWSRWEDRPPRFLGERFFLQSVDVPMELSQYVVIVPEDLNLEYEQMNFGQEPKVFARGKKTIYIWEAKEIPAIPDEPLAAPSTEFLPFVRVGVNFDMSAEIFRYLDHNVEMARTTDSIRAATARVLADCTDDAESRVREICSFVNKEVRGGGGSAYIGASASETLADKRGDRLCLAKAMLDAAGIESRMLVVRERLAHCSEAFPGSFSSALLGILDKEGRFSHFLDFGSRYLPFGYVRARLQGGSAVPLEDFSCADFGLGGGDEGLRRNMLSIPRLPTDMNCERRTLTASVDEDGSLEGTHVHEYTGDDGAALRAAITKAQAFQIKAFIERMASASYRAAVLKDQKVENLLNVEKPLLVEYVFQAPNFGRVTGEAMILDQWLPSLRSGATFASLQVRKTPLQINAELHSRFQAVLKIPFGAEVVAVPSRVSLETDFGFYHLRVSEGDGLIRVENHFYLEAQRISPDDYPRFAGFCRSVDEAERKEIRIRLKS